MNYTGRISHGPWLNCPALADSYLRIITLFRISLILCCFRNEISSLTEKIRSLEIAQVNQRKQQAIAMAALAAEKLRGQKRGNEFQSDSNLAYSTNSDQNGVNKRIPAPIGKRLLLKVRKQSF